MQRSELKPCPCCEGKAKYFIDTMVYGSPDHIVYCTNCGLRVTGYNSKKEAMEAWNKSPNPWHTGTPTEEGWYLMKVKSDDEIIHDTNYLTPCVYGMDWRYAHEEIIEWQKIEENEDDWWKIHECFYR